MFFLQILKQPFCIESNNVIIKVLVTFRAKKKFGPNFENSPIFNILTGSSYVPSSIYIPQLFGAFKFIRDLQKDQKKQKNNAVSKTIIWNQ